MRKRILAVAAAGVVLAAVAVGYTVHAAGRAESSAPDSRVTPANTAGLYYRAADGTIAVRTGSTRKPTSLSCRRFHVGGPTAVCLTTRAGLPPMTRAVVLDRALRTRHTIDFGGTPNRARVSPSGRMVSWTVFVSGDSYATTAFSTRTGIYDTRTGYLIKSMESIQLYLNGERYHAPDVNFWGVTFTDDDNRFYATVSTAGQTYLVEGDMKAWKARALRTNVECPSLSPDGTRLAFKKRVRGGAEDPWRLHVLDLRTMRETPLAEARGVDDQVTWLDEHTVAYALPDGDGGTDVWSVPTTGDEPPRLLAPDASSPVLVNPRSG
jgi:hypothetical protein